MKKIEINPDRCMGCMTCCNVCSFTHEGEFNPGGARLKITWNLSPGEVEGQVLESCDLCGGTPECVRWCPVGALKYA